MILKTVFICLCLTALPVSCSSNTPKDNSTSVAENYSTCQNTVRHRSVLDSCIYTKSDSSKIVSMLKMDIPAGESDILFYARKFIGSPYVASTLEGDEDEPIVINTRSLDCTTLVETVCALAMTKRHGGDKFADYAKSLESIRYRGGKRNGYLSRLHYFTWWMDDGVEKGIFEEVEDPKNFTAKKHVRNHYMSTYPHKYSMLKLHPEWRDSIAELEKAYNGIVANYLPEKRTSLGKEELSSIKDGDILAIVTKKDGLDYSHLGFAVWGKDGKLHLLNASSIYKRVVEDKRTLFNYLLGQRSAIGVKVLRLR